MDGTNLKRLRKLAGFDYAKDFAERIGVSPQAYSHYEKGDCEIPMGRAIEMADVLGCTLDELVGRVQLPAVETLTPIQARYDALGKDARGEVDRFLSYVEYQEQSRKQTAKARNNAQSVAEVVKFIIGAGSAGVPVSTMRKAYELILDSEIDGQIERRRSEKWYEFQNGNNGGKTLDEFMDEFAESVRKRQGKRKEQMLRIFDEIAGEDLSGIEMLISSSEEPPEGYKYTISEF